MKLPKNLKVREQGEANQYFVIDDKNNWVASLQLNGEYTTAKQIRLTQTFAIAPDMFDALLSLARACKESSEAMRRVSYDPEVTRLFELVEQMAGED
jgi:hypothetical protein